MELPDIAFKRIQFLRRYVEIKQQNLYPFVFTDETWIFQNGTLGHSKQDESKHSVKGRWQKVSYQQNPLSQSLSIFCF